jgi:hypothetical protein
VATVYFRTGAEADQWARDLLTRLPQTDRQTSDARAPAWRIRLVSAKIIRTHATRSLSPWRVVSGSVLAVLEQRSSAQCGHMSNNPTCRWNHGAEV